MSDHLLSSLAEVVWYYTAVSVFLFFNIFPHIITDQS